MINLYKWGATYIQSAATYEGHAHEENICTEVVCTWKDTHIEGTCTRKTCGQKGMRHVQYIKEICTEKKHLHKGPYTRSNIHMERYAQEKKIYTKETNAQKDIKMKETRVQRDKLTERHLHKRTYTYSESLCVPPFLVAVHPFLNPFSLF